MPKVKNGSQFRFTRETYYHLFPMPPRIPIEDRRLAIRVRNGKYCGECGGRKLRTGVFCSICFDQLPDALRRGLLDKVLWPAVFHEARKWFANNPPLKS